MDYAKTKDFSIDFKASATGKAVSAEEIKLIRAHLGDLLIKVLMETEEE